MTGEKRFSRESRRSLQTGAGDAGATRGSAGSPRQSGGAYQDTPDISHVAEAAKLFHDTRRAPVVAASSRPALPGHSGSVFNLARLRDAAEAARRVARAGRVAIRRQNPSSLRARRGRSRPRCGELTFRTPTRHRAPSQQPGRILIPGDGAAGIRGPQNRPGYATPAACPVSTTSWRYDLRRTCRLVTGRSPRPRSTWPNQAPPPLPAVKARV
jgi:hypothetical protein